MRRVEDVETIMLVQDETLPGLSMENVPAPHHHLVLNALADPDTIELLPVHETRRQGI